VVRLILKRIAIQRYISPNGNAGQRGETKYKFSDSGNTATNGNAGQVGTGERTVPNVGDTVTDGNGAVHAAHIDAVERRSSNVGDTVGNGNLGDSGKRIIQSVFASRAIKRKVPNVDDAVRNGNTFQLFPSKHAITFSNFSRRISITTSIINISNRLSVYCCRNC